MIPSPYHQFLAEGGRVAGMAIFLLGAFIALMNRGAAFNHNRLGAATAGLFGVLS